MAELRSLGTTRPSLDEVMSLAKDELVVLRQPDGSVFALSPVDDFAVEVVDLHVGGDAGGAEPLSSTLTRRLVAEGDVEAAAAFLVRAHRAEGAVARSAQPGGTTTVVSIDSTIAGPLRVSSPTSVRGITSVGWKPPSSK